MPHLQVPLNGQPKVAEQHCIKSLGKEIQLKSALVPALTQCGGGQREFKGGRVDHSKN
jgi:hypothetical protein